MKTDMATDFVMVLEIHNAGDRVFLRSILDAEGVDYFIQGETVAPYIFNSVPMRLMVRNDQAKRVCGLLDVHVEVVVRPQYMVDRFKIERKLP